MADYDPSILAAALKRTAENIGREVAMRADREMTKPNVFVIGEEMLPASEPTFVYLRYVQYGDRRQMRRWARRTGRRFKRIKRSRPPMYYISPPTRVL